MGSSKTPEVVHPGEAAQAAMGVAGAGEMASIANQPIDIYGNLMNTLTMGPAIMQAQTALSGRGAKQAAQQQMDIQSSVDPQAYAQRQMRMDAANARLGKLYGKDPTAFSYAAPSNTYAVPGTADLPDPTLLAQNARALASNLSTGYVNRAGANPGIRGPVNTVAGAYQVPTSYL